MTTAPPSTLLMKLKEKLNTDLKKIQESEPYKIFSASETDLKLTIAIVRNVLLEVFSYGPHVTEATFTAIGRMPKSRPDLMKPMILHDLSEVDHGEMALKDFIRLGGNEAWARSRRITPQSFAMAATCRMLAEYESPFAYLGYMFLFEELTPILTEHAQKILEARGFPNPARVFIDTHATEDIAHASLMDELILKVTTEFPSEAEAIEYGYDCFAAVYPLPIWDAAFARAKTEIGR